MASQTLYSGGSIDTATARNRLVRECFLGVAGFTVFALAVPYIFAWVSSLIFR